MSEQEIKYKLGQDVAVVRNVMAWAQGNQPNQPSPLKIHSIYQEKSRVVYQVAAGGAGYNDSELVPYEEVTSQAILYLSTRLMEVAKS